MTTSQAVPPVEFTVENIERLIANNDTWYSPPFYSHLGGYKMRLRVEPEFVVLYINISVCLMKGEFDDDLSWPLEGTLTLEQPFNTKVELRASKPKEGEIGLSLFLLHEAPDLTLCVRIHYARALARKPHPFPHTSVKRKYAEKGR